MEEKIIFEYVNECPVCGYMETQDYLQVKDLAITKEDFKLVACKKCDFKYTNPRPNENTIGKYYQSNNYISHQDENKGIISRVYYLVKQQNLKNKLKLINQLKEKGRLMDVGCGTGSFLEICKKDRWHITGVEPNREARKRAETKTESLIRESIFTIRADEKFDIITLWHVVEHIHKLNETIKKINELLAKNGKVIIAVPNVESYDAKYFKNYWAAYDAPRHLYHFSQSTIIKLMQKHDMKIEKIIPMTYDAYYISLLSYKYKYNNTNYISAIKTGFKSNQLAKRDNNYSSLTYIFSK